MKNQLRFDSLLIVISLAISGCGVKESPKEANVQVSENKVGQQKMNEASFLVEREDELKACTKELKGSLAYVKDKAEFKTCSGEAWETVSIKGQDGKNGVDGKDGIVVDRTVWKDEMTGLTWKAFGIAQKGPITDWFAAGGIFNLVCKGTDYRIPTKNEASLAANYGLYQAFKELGDAYQNVWVFDPSGNGYRRFDTMNVRFTANEPVSTEASPQNLTAAVVCIKQ